MSDLTDFFPAAGGGGGGMLTDPSEMSRVYVYQPRCEVKSAESSHSFLAGQYYNIFSIHKGGIYDTLTAADTYVTTHDITSSTPGGGVLRLLQFASLYSGAIGDSSTCRITLDGTEYIFSPTLTYADSQGYYRPLMGNFVLDGMARITNSTGNGTDTNNFGNNYRGVWSGGSASTELFSGGFTPGSQNGTGYTYVPTVGSMGQLGGVRFKESLKIEFKADKVGAGSYASNRVCSLVTKF